MKKTFFTLIILFAGVCMLHAQNLLTNAGFENSFTDWTNVANGGSVATFSIETASVQEGTKAMKAVITTLGPNAWSIESSHIPWASVQGKEYKFTFYGKAAVNGTKIRAVQQKTLYAASDFALTTSWQKFEWTFTAQEANQQLKFHLFALGTIYLDDLTISETVVSTGTTDAFTITPTEKFQTMDGFGGAIAFYDNWLTDHPNKEEIYKYIFKDLGLDWLRLRNNYRNQPNFTHISTEFVQKANFYTEDSIRVFMSSWSPPATLKSNSNTNNGTLKKENGTFLYDAFATYWKDALIAYEKLGVRPKWISIQNEPDWLTDAWETCKFTETETVDFPGYDKALDAVYGQIKTLPNVPKLIGAEPLGIGYGNFTKYTDPIKTKSYLSAYAYHLYHGGDPLLPDSYKKDMNNIKQNYNDRPNYMTEYENMNAGWFKNAWLINNALTDANVSAYFYWDLVWPKNGLVNLDNPYTPSSWTTPKGYALNPQFYAFKHFCKHIKPGYKRIGGINSHSAIRSSAFLSPDGNEMVIILLNTFTQAITSTIAATGWTVNSSVVYQSTEGNLYQDKGSLAANAQIQLPVNSLTTIILKKGTVTTNTPPTVNITSPVNNASFIAPASIAITATAADADGTVSNVDFYNGTTLLGSDATAPYTFTWAGVAAGTYSITAKATDNAGAITTSTGVSVIVTSNTANTPPTVNITSPANNASFVAPASIAITATATDANGTVSNVQFYNGTTLLGSDAVAPYTFTWAGAAAGTYSITAKATDNAGAVTTSTVILITITGGTTVTADIIGPDCGTNNSTLMFELNAAKRANVSTYNWWYTGSAASTTQQPASPYQVAIQTGSSFSAGQVCVGVNLKVAPWYTSFCKSIVKCATVIGPNPNPATNSFTITATENISSYAVTDLNGNMLIQGNVVPKGVTIQFGASLPKGAFVFRIIYNNGTIETKNIQKLF